MLSIDVPAGLVPNLATKALRLHVSSPGCLDEDLPLAQTGPRAISLPLACPPTDVPAPMEIQLDANKRLPFTRQIDSLPHARAYWLVSARLQWAADITL